jgi:hypothetical protein
VATVCRRQTEGLASGAEISSVWLQIELDPAHFSTEPALDRAAEFMTDL